MEYPSFKVNIASKYLTGHGKGAFYADEFMIFKESIVFYLDGYEVLSIEMDNLEHMRYNANNIIITCNVRKFGKFSQPQGKCEITIGKFSFEKDQDIVRGESKCLVLVLMPAMSTYGKNCSENTKHLIR